ncbi:MAG: hypothetical protein PHY02_05120 [Phycisphaerae bacterium]|nr:hypothetical protein [Phycisphaerae bacterium]
MGKGHLKKFKSRETQSKNGIKLHSTITPNFQFMKPLFDIRCDCSEYCLERCDSSTKEIFASTIHKLGQMTWQQIDVAPKNGLGYEKIPIAQIKPVSPISVSPEEKVKVFRLTDKARMGGVRVDGRTLSILWVTSEHDLY